MMSSAIFKVNIPYDAFNYFYDDNLHVKQIKYNNLKEESNIWKARSK